jgi:hypothetical protein
MEGWLGTGGRGGRQPEPCAGGRVAVIALEGGGLARRRRVGSCERAGRGPEVGSLGEEAASHGHGGVSEEAALVQNVIGEEIGWVVRRVEE